VLLWDAHQLKLVTTSEWENMKREGMKYMKHVNCGKRIKEKEIFANKVRKKFEPMTFSSPMQTLFL